MAESGSEENEISKSLNESGITMVDVLKEEEELEDDAAAVLGAGDDSDCTYDKGYMKRQPIYSCKTCLPIEKEICGGICLGCSYHCHEGHELVELYTKRNFCCDCGNSKYPESNVCKFAKNKSITNTENCYNHNFLGKYCTCCRPYPDPEDHIEDQMIQCIICEDWYHGRHLGVDSLPTTDEFSEMICGKCIPKYDVLKNYLGFAVTTISTSSPSKTSMDVDVTTEEVQSKENESSNNEVPKKSTKEDHSKSKLSESESKSGGSFLKEGVCKLNYLSELPYSSGAIFFGNDWRDEMCTCSSCQELYANLGISFLIDPEDTVSHYESEGRAKRQNESGIQREIDALSSLDRITRTEMVHEYNNLSSSLREYLKKFADNGKVVRDEDIREFFSELSANKKRKKNEGMQFFCK